MSTPQVRFFDQSGNRVFRLSPLYASPGWYSMTDEGGTIGPYPKAEHVTQKAGQTAATSERTPNKT